MRDPSPKAFGMMVKLECKLCMNSICPIIYLAKKSQNTQNLIAPSLWYNNMVNLLVNKLYWQKQINFLSFAHIQMKCTTVNTEKLLFLARYMKNYY